MREWSDEGDTYPPKMLDGEIVVTRACALAGADHRVLLYEKAGPAPVPTSTANRRQATRPVNLGAAPSGDGWGDPWQTVQHFVQSAVTE
jgi:hypothetical protein